MAGQLTTPDRSNHHPQNGAETETERVYRDHPPQPPNETAKESLDSAKNNYYCTDVATSAANRAQPKNRKANPNPAPLQRATRDGPIRRGRLRLFWFGMLVRGGFASGVCHGVVAGVAAGCARGGLHM